MEQETLNKILVKIDGLDSKVSGLESNQDRILVKVIEIDSRLGDFATKDQFESRMKDVITTV